MNIKKINRRIERISRWMNESKNSNQVGTLFLLYRRYKNNALIREMESYKWLAELIEKGELSVKRDGDGLFYVALCRNIETKDTAVIDAFIAIQAIREDFHE